MSAHKYWRVLINSVFSGSIINLGELQLLDSVGVNHALSGFGTAIESSNDGTHLAANVIDGSFVTYWQANADLGVAGAWIGFQFPADTEVVNVKIGTPSAGSGAAWPNSFDVDFSDNGSSWTSAGTFTGQSTLASTLTNYSLGGNLTADLTLPSLALTADFGASADLTLPMLTLAADFGISADLTLPALTLQSDFGAGADLTLPSLTLDSAAHESTGENHIDLVLPMLTLQADFGASASLTLPSLTLDAAMTGTALITVDLTLPMLTLDAQGTGSPYIVTVDVALPMLTLEAYFGAGCELDLPSLTLDASMTAGGVLTADLRLPMLTLDAQATQQNWGWIELTLPMLVPGSSITADLTLPMLSLDAQITAVVSISYEAYAINLKHADPAAPNEVTRYTNFPFTQIIRYKDDYYGIGAAGLYKLGGVTDYAATPTVIPWAWKTATTDFKSPFQKTIISAYFGGRMGPASTVTLTAGEGTGVNYSFTTPRGALAQNYRQTFGRGVKSRYYALGASGSGELALDDVELNIATLSRRI